MQRREKVRDKRLTGLLLDRLIRAADRGVRVRILIDDLVILGIDESLDGRRSVEWVRDAFLP